MKRFFCTKKRAVISTLCIVTATAVITAAVYAAVWGRAIAAVDAEHIAFADAGVEQADIRFIHTEYDKEDGKAVYEVEFISNNIDYHYYIDAANGRVLSRSCKVDDGWTAEMPVTENAAAGYVDTSVEETAQLSTEAVKNPSSGISVDEAKNIAVTHAGVSLDMVTFKKAKLENDDGRTEYEIEFCCDGMEYECTIDAANGTVLDYESEHCDDDNYHEYDSHHGHDSHNHHD